MGQLIQLSDHRKAHPVPSVYVLPLTFIAAYLAVTVALCEALLGSDEQRG